MSNTKPSWPWSQLGLPYCPDSERDIRRAYAARLKEIDAEADIEGFEALRAAYDAARRMVKSFKSVKEGAAPKHGHRTVVSQVTNPRASAQPQQVATPPKPRVTGKGAKSKGPTDTPPKLKPSSKPAAPSKPPEQAGPWGAEDLSDPQVLLRKAQNLVEGKHLNAEDWAPLLKSSALDDPAVSRHLQQTMVAFLSQRIQSGGNISGGRGDLCGLIDDRFGWVSDGIGFLRQFPNARTLQATMAKVLREDRWRDAARAGAVRPPPKDFAKRIPPLMWVFPFVAWLFLLAV
ncbi:hypothetical protein [Roseovarius rhodophyticola]|uniref:J domain-containing protein n=1 Tax=Roseovarius rhodophyticola TaxID=3080827 RepID=A0ABZ2THD2_9RHOB|nr:hypothetical protein [Roseovarius sp. W115]MDV2929330.1 hypothetical protein [Roseovarius sp. W115]